MHPTEKKFPKQVKGFQDTVDKMVEVHKKKNLDYSPSNILIAGEYGIITRIWDKVSRICNLMGLTFPAPEPLIDNLIDDIEQDGLDTKQILERLDEIKSKCKWDFKNIKAHDPCNESLMDSWLDLSVYAIIGKLYSENKWGR